MQQTLPHRILFHPVSKRQLSKRLYTRRRRHRGTLRLCGTSRASDLASNLDLVLTPTLPRRRSSSESAHTTSCAEEATISSRKRREETVSISLWRVLVLSLKCTKARNARECCAGAARSIEIAWNDIIFCIARQSRRGRKGPSRCADSIAAEGWKIVHRRLQSHSISIFLSLPSCPSPYMQYCNPNPASQQAWKIPHILKAQGTFPGSDMK